MQPRPNNPELATAVREFLESEIMPTLSDARLKFRTLVAMNALSMLERLPLEEAFLAAEACSLAALLGEAVPNAATRVELERLVLAFNSKLSTQIRQNKAPDGAFEVLQEIAVQKLKIASPNYLRRYT